MNKNKIDTMVRLVFLFSVFAFCFSVHAQNDSRDTLESRNVLVEKEFLPVIQDVGKILSTPLVMQASVKKKNANYLSMNLPMDIENAFQAMSAKSQLALEPNVNPVFVELGYGNYFNSYGNLVVPIIQKSKTELGLNALHNASMGYRKFSETNTSLQFHQDFDRFHLGAHAGLSYRFWNYYGCSFDVSADSLAQISNPNDLSLRYFNGGVALSSKATEFDRFALNATVDYSLTSLSNTLSENRFTANTDLNFSLHKSVSRPFGLVISADILKYNQDYSLIPDTAQSSLELFFSPYWKYEIAKFSAKLGFNLQMCMTDTTRLYVSPNVSLSYAPFTKYMSFVAGIDGGVETVGLNDLMYLNPYITDGLILRDVYTPVRPYIGLIVSPVAGLQLNLNADYSYKQNDHFFINHQSVNFDNRFDVIYADVHASRFNLDATYSFKDKFRMNLNSSYTLWYNQTDFEQAWLKPAFVTQLIAEYKYNSKFSFNLAVLYQTPRYAKFDLITKKLNSVLDVQLGANYSINSHFGAFLKVNNLLNHHHEYLVGYDTQGVNFMLGGSYRL